MTTSRPVAAANRRNAQRSTGPHSAEGKRCAARNAVRHGLRTPVSADPALADEIAEVADRLAGGSQDPRMQELAGAVAAAHVDVQRVRRARGVLSARRMMDADRMRLLCTLDRYERKAIWRRKAATRAWLAARFDSIRSAP